MNLPLPQYHFLLLFLQHLPLLFHQPLPLLGPRRPLRIAGNGTETEKVQVSPVRPPLHHFIKTAQVIPFHPPLFEEIFSLNGAILKQARCFTSPLPLFSSRHLSLQVMLAERRGPDGTCVTVRWLIFLASGRCVPSATSVSRGASRSPSLSCRCIIRPAAGLSGSETSCCSGDRSISELIKNL